MYLCQQIVVTPISHIFCFTSSRRRRHFVLFSFNFILLPIRRSSPDGLPARANLRIVNDTISRILYTIAWRSSLFFIVRRAQTVLSMYLRTDATSCSVERARAHVAYRRETAAVTITRDGPPSGPPRATNRNRKENNTVKRTCRRTENSPTQLVLGDDAASCTDIIT